MKYELSDHVVERVGEDAALELAAALGEVARSVCATLDLSVILERIFDMLGRFIPYDSAAIMLLRQGSLVVAAGRGFPPELDVREVVLSYHPQTAHYPVVAEGRVLVLEDARNHAGWQEVPGHQLVRAWMGVPLVVEERVIGMLTIDKWEPGVYTSQHAAVVQAFAGHVAIAIRNAQLYDESQRAYAELRRAQAEMLRHERLRALGEFALGVAHDFNNILAAIIGNIQLLTDELGDPAMRAALQVIEQAADDGAATIRQLQDFARTSPSGPCAPANLRDIAEAALALTRPRWQSRVPAIQVVSALTPVVTAPVEASALRQVLTNLIINALDAMPDGGVLQIVTGASQREAFMLVQDTGIGMTPDLQEHIFEPFVSTKGLRGSGMGLAMSQALIARQGGRITVESAPSAGSTFTIWLPLGEEG